uniref:Uncharacterized protein n=1 Tax=Amphimedon queenslandica TaxID=400682 RepID=A0A1X7TJJ3_AMPQE
MAGNILPTVQANQLGLEPREEPNIILYGPPDDWGHQKEKGFTEIDILSSLLTGPQAKEIVLFKEENFTFDIALATARNNSWEGIHHGARHALQFEKKKLKLIELCSKLGQQPDMMDTALMIMDRTDLSQTKILSNLQDVLKTPAPPSVDLKGKVVWYQYPWTNGELSIKEIAEEMKDQQERDDYLLIGKLFNYSDCYSTREVNRHCHSYRYLGVDYEFVNKLVSYGYSYQGQEESANFEEQVIFVLQRKPSSIFD